jgi:hypothetical protein
MNNLSLRNVLIVIGSVVAALIVLGVISTVLTQIVPLLIVAVAAFILGRLSVNVNLLDATRSALSRGVSAASQAAAKPAARPAVQTQAEPTASADADPGKTVRLPQTDRLDEARLNVADREPVLKSEEEVLAEARRREEEIAKRSAGYDPSAALEERRRRLLGGKGDDNQ